MSLFTSLYHFLVHLNGQLQMTFWELVIIGIPEGCLVVLGVFCFGNITIQIKKYIVTSVVFILSTFLIKNLLNLGVNMMVSFLILVVLLFLYNKIEIIKSIKFSIIVSIVLVVCEMSSLIIFVFTKVDYKNLRGLQKAIYGVPHIVIFGLVILIYYLIYQNNIKKKVTDGKIHTKTGR